MTPKELAREFMTGFRTNLSCPDVSPSEYEAVMEGYIEAQMRGCVLLGATMYAVAKNESALLSENPIMRKIAEEASSVLREPSVQAVAAAEQI